MKRTWFWIVLIALAILAVYVCFLWLGPSALKLIDISVSDAKEITETFKSVVEVIAIIVAGFWTYERFIKTKEETREEHPYPNLQHRIEHFPLEKNLVYLSVFVTVTNVGKRKLSLSRGKIYIRQVSPMPRKVLRDVLELVDDQRSSDIRSGKAPSLFIDGGQRLCWEKIGEREWMGLGGKILELEPGQTREIQFDFLISNEVDVIEAISYFDEKLGWGLATLYSLETIKRRQLGKN